MQNFMNQAREQVTHLAERAKEMIPGQKDKHAGPGQPSQAGQASGVENSASAAAGHKPFDMSKLSIKQDISRNRFSCMLDTEEAYVDYKLNDSDKAALAGHGHDTWLKNETGQDNEHADCLHHLQTIEISYLYVPPSYRDQGIASRLLTDCHSFAKAKGYSCTPSSEAKPFVEKWLSENAQFKDMCRC